MKHRTLIGRLATGVALAAASIMSLTACVSGATPPAGGGGGTEPAGSGTPGELTSVMVGVPPTSFATALYAGVSEGIFEQHGFDVELTPIGSMAEAAPRLLAGELQYIWSDMHNMLLSRSEGVPIVVGAPGTVNTTEAPTGKGFGNLLVLEESSIQSLKDLEGKTIGTNSLGGQAMLDNQTMLEKNGVDVSKIEWVALPTQQAIASLRQGQVDAITIAEPGGTAAMAEGGVRMVGSADDAIPGAPMFVLAATEEWVNGDLDRAKAFQDAVIEANTLINGDRELGTTVMTTFMQQVPEAVLADSVLPTFAEAPFTAASTQPVIDRMIKVGAITEDKVPDLGALLPLS